MDTTVNPGRWRALASRWITRGLGLLVIGFFGWIVALALTNEDPLPPQGRPVIWALLACLAGVVVSWRWERAGGALTVLGALGLAVAVLASGLVTGLGWEAGLVAVAYPIPFLIVGGLALSEGGRAAASGGEGAR